MQKQFKGRKAKCPRDRMAECQNGRMAERQECQEAGRRVEGRWRNGKVGHKRRWQEDRGCMAIDWKMGNGKWEMKHGRKTARFPWAGIPSSYEHTQLICKMLHFNIDMFL